MNPQVLNQSPDLEHRAPSHAKKRILKLNKGKLQKKKKKNRKRRGINRAKTTGKQPEVPTG